MLERMVDITTEDGIMNTYFYYPDEGGPHPVVLFGMDSAGAREPLSDMCRRLAAAGYFVIMPNLYYRRQRYLDINVDRYADPSYGNQVDLMWSLNKHLTNTMVMNDFRTILQHLESETAARSGKFGILGYCMSGPFAYRAAGDLADRVAAAVSMYGSPLISDALDSSHLTTKKIKGEIYFGFAEREVYFSATETIKQLKTYFGNTGINCRIELYHGCEHGFALPGRRVYDKNSSERHWVRVNDIFRRNLW